MIWSDLREYLDALRRASQLRDVRGADWEREIGTIAELMTERNGPALLFSEIPGYPPGHRVAANVFTTPTRTAMAFGLRPDGDLNAQWRERLDAYVPLAPAWRQDGPVTENVVGPADIDLERFPVPRWHEADGGRYIGTGCCVINRDAGSGFVNVGTYRVSILDRGRCSIFIEAGKHGFENARSHWARGSRCPVVVTVGQEPILTAVAESCPYRPPAEVAELELAGYLQGEPYPVVAGEATGLPIPAAAEIALEGFIPSPDEVLEPEGPFGEWTGYYAHGRQPELVVELARVYHRGDPILLGQPPIRPVGCYQNPNLGADDAGTLLRLRREGIEEVQRVCFVARPNLRAVAVRQRDAGSVGRVVRAVGGGGDQYMGHQIWVLVDEDIDVANQAEVLWAIATRCSPETAVTVVPGTGYWQLDPRIPPGRRSAPDLETGRGRRRYEAANLVLDCCRPFAWRDRFPPVAMNSRALRDEVERKWRSVLAPPG